jgi:hypothetical protein
LCSSMCITTWFCRDSEYWSSNIPGRSTSDNLKELDRNRLAVEGEGKGKETTGGEERTHCRGLLAKAYPWRVERLRVRGRAQLAQEGPTETRAAVRLREMRVTCGLRGWIRGQFVPLCYIYDSQDRGGRSYLLLNPPADGITPQLLVVESWLLLRKS